MSERYLRIKSILSKSINHLNDYNDDLSDEETPVEKTSHVEVDKVSMLKAINESNKDTINDLLKKIDNLQQQKQVADEVIQRNVKEHNHMVNMYNELVQTCDNLHKNNDMKKKYEDLEETLNAIIKENERLSQVTPLESIENDFAHVSVPDGITQETYTTNKYYKVMGGMINHLYGYIVYLEELVENSSDEEKVLIDMKDIPDEYLVESYNNDKEYSISGILLNYLNGYMNYLEDKATKVKDEQLIENISMIQEKDKKIEGLEIEKKNINSIIQEKNREIQRLEKELDRVKTIPENVLHENKVAKLACGAWKLKCDQLSEINFVNKERLEAKEKTIQNMDSNLSILQEQLDKIKNTISVPKITINQTGKYDLLENCLSHMENKKEWNMFHSQDLYTQVIEMLNEYNFMHNKYYGCLSNKNYFYTPEFTKKDIVHLRKDYNDYVDLKKQMKHEETMSNIYDVMIGRMNIRMKHYKYSIKNLRQVIKNIDEQLDQYQQRVISDSAKTLDLENKVDWLETEMAKNCIEMVKQEDHIKYLEGYISTIKSVNNGFNDLLMEVERLKKERENLLEKINSLDTEINTLNQQNSAYKKVDSDATNLLTKYKETIDYYEQKLIPYYKEENLDLSDRIRGMNEEIQKLKSDNKKLLGPHKSVDDALHERDLISKQFEIMEEQIDALRNDRNNLLSEVGNIKMLNADLKKEITKLMDTGSDEDDIVLIKTN